MLGIPSQSSEISRSVFKRREIREEVTSLGARTWA